jgi:hypothetical protein
MAYGDEVRLVFRVEEMNCFNERRLAAEICVHMCNEERRT